MLEERVVVRAGEQLAATVGKLEQRKGELVPAQEQMFNAKSGVVVRGECVQERFGFSSFVVSARSVQHLHERSIGEKVHENAAVALVGQPVEV